MKKWLIFASVLCLVFVAAACGSNSNGNNDGSNAASSTVADVVIKASSWEFDQPEYHIKKGQSIKLELIDGVHGVEIEKSNLKLAQNKIKTVTLDAGEYEISCNIPCGQGHSKMTAKLIVEEA
ncbi:cytochrome C oxidase subunit II [Paenibacillus glycanilyticus]|uniref:cytochrome C oxidase subunit II n=1 Tax=Paenibacillus glycanilyticus TaxID=126569 RepID=UPI00203DCD3D|nr:cytochrome C oxidase subunit II [Paenibacillus glycanilyticus]MCM3628962.1 cytochrome C oxidase subunit II [Paenibacillus glycanilyticus]